MPELQSLEYYTGLAKQVAGYFIPKKFSMMKGRLLNDNDLLTNVVSALIKADENFDETRGCTIRSYRNQQGYYAIANYVRTLGKITSSVEKDISDEKYNPEKLAIKTEEKNYVHFLINHANLTDLQKQYLNMKFFDSKTNAEISREMQVSHQHVKQTIDSAIIELQIASGVIPLE